MIRRVQGNKFECPELRRVFVFCGLRPGAAMLKVRVTADWVARWKCKYDCAPDALRYPGEYARFLAEVYTKTEAARVERLFGAAALHRNHAVYEDCLAAIRVMHLQTYRRLYRLQWWQ